MSSDRTDIRNAVAARARLVPAAAGIALLAGVLLAACGGGESSKNSTSSSSSITTTSATQTSAATSTTVTGTAVSPGLVKATAGEVTATLRAGTHKPRVNAAWPIHFRVLEGSTPAKAHVSYEYMFGGSVVAKRSHYAFSGHFSDVFRWPSSAVGYPLTFRAVIIAGGQTLNLDYPVKVER